MSLFHLLNLQECLELYPKVEPYLPDAMRNPTLWASSINAFKIENGSVWLSDIRVGFRANIHVVTWGPHSSIKPERVVEYLMSLYNLQRLEALIPSDNYKACRLAEEMGFTYEGLLRKADKYEGKLVGLHVYSKIKEE